MKANIKASPKKFSIENIEKDFKHNKILFLLILPVLVYIIVFHYIPMSGIIMAFQNYKPALGILGSKFVGFRHFKDFFSSIYFQRTLSNTIAISLKDLCFNFPAAIIFALLLNEIGNKYFKKTVQTISYMPHFISLVVVSGLIIDFCNDGGLVAIIYNRLTGNVGGLMQQPKLFQQIYTVSSIWQSIGFNSILYIAALAGVDKELYDAARVDGANRWQQMLHVTLPGISTTIIIMLILKVGMTMNVGFEKIILLYNPLTMEKADVISSFVYRKGLEEFNYGYSAAVSLFNSVINFVLICVTNHYSKKMSDTSLF